MHPGVRQVPIAPCITHSSLFANRDVPRAKGDVQGQGPFSPLWQGAWWPNWVFSHSLVASWLSCCYRLLKEMSLHVWWLSLTDYEQASGLVGYCPADSLTAKCSGNLLVHSWMINFSCIRIWDICIGWTNLTQDLQETHDLGGTWGQRDPGHLRYL